MEPRSSSPSRRSHPHVDRTDGEDEKGRTRLSELEQREFNSLSGQLLRPVHPDEPDKSRLAPLV